MEEQVKKCKVVVVGDTECGKTALLSVFTKDRFPECYAPTVFENYTASLELELQRVELRLWDTSGSRYYDNVRPLSYPDADAVLICFDISRPETLDNVLEKWGAEVQEFCPHTQRLLVGCKLDLRTDLFSPSRDPVSYDQGSRVAQQLSAPYLECSSLQSESSIRDLFHMAALACISKKNHSTKRRRSRTRQRMSHSGDTSSSALHYQQTEEKSCALM